MRIAYMLTSLSVGGAERQVLALAERMRAHGHDVVLIVLRPKHACEIWQSDVEIVRLDMTKSPLGIWRGLWRGRKYLREFRPDIVHSHTFPANMIARLLRLLGVAPIVISTIHNVYEGRWHRMLAYRLTDPLATHTTAVSQAVIERYVEIGAVSQRKCSVVTNGIDTDGFSLSRVSSRAIKESLHSELVEAGPGFKWMAAGRFVPAKDFANLFAAFGLVRLEVPDAQLWIAGYGKGGHRDDDSETVEHHPQKAPTGVHALGVLEDIPGRMAASDAFVLSSAWEGMPLVVGEAMGMERPVVATDVGGVRELVGDAGVIVPSRNAKALAEGMLRVMRMSEDERKKMGKAARDRTVQHFNMDGKAAEWEALYTGLLGDPR